MAGQGRDALLVILSARNAMKGMPVSPIRREPILVEISSLQGKT